MCLPITSLAPTERFYQKYKSAETAKALSEDGDEKVLIDITFSTQLAQLNPLSRLLAQFRLRLPLQSLFLSSTLPL